MKILFAALISSSICLSYGEPDKEYIAEIKAVAAKCSKEFNIDKDTVNALMKDFKIPESDEGKCMIACFLKELKLLNGGKLDADHFLSFNRREYDKKEIIDKADNIDNQCIKSVGTDAKDNECQYAYELASCISKAALKENLPSKGITLD